MATAHALPRRRYHVGFTAALLISTLKSHEGTRGRDVLRFSAVVDPDPRCDLWPEWDVLSGRSVLDPAARNPRLFLKRSFVLIAAIDRSSARRSLYVRRNRWQISCLYHFNVLSALTSIARIYFKVICVYFGNVYFGKANSEGIKI